VAVSRGQLTTTSACWMEEINGGGNQHTLHNSRGVFQILQNSGRFLMKVTILKGNWPFTHFFVRKSKVISNIIIASRDKKKDYKTFN